VPPGARVTPHFSFAELVATEHRQFVEEQRQAPPWVRANLVRLAVDVLEPCRGLVGPIHVSSAYRCPGLNLAVGSHSGSQHLIGLACDWWPLEMPILQAYEIIRESTIPWDQLILERGTWIHISAPRHAQDPRRQALMMWTTGRYEKFARNDPRVRGMEATWTS
jgi:hypothetical protein